MTRFATLFTLLLVPALAFAQKDLAASAPPSFAGGPGNDNLENATLITGDGIYESSVSGATSEANETPASCTFGGTSNDTGNSIYFQFTPGMDGTVSLDTDGSALDTGDGFVDTLVSILTGSEHPLSEVACNDDDPNNGAGDFTSALVDVPVTAGTTYYIRVSTFDAARTQGDIRLSFTGPALTGTAAEDGPEAQTLSLGEAVPNPSAGPVEMMLTVDEPQALDVAVFDMLGRRVLDVYAGTATTDIALVVDTRSLRSGVYVVRAMGNASSAVRVFTVAR